MEKEINRLKDYTREHHCSSKNSHISCMYKQCSTCVNESKDVFIRFMSNFIIYTPNKENANINKIRYRFNEEERLRLIIEYPKLYAVYMEALNKANE